jgi:hypothetical protein
MENPTYIHNMKSMRDALTLRKFIEQEQDEDECDRRLSAILDGYVQDLRYRLGLVDPYLDDLHRLSLVKETVRAMDPIFDRMTEMAGDDPLPPAALGLWKFLWNIALDLAWVIRYIEEQHEDLKEFFKPEREMYTEIRWHHSALEEEAEADE